MANLRGNIASTNEELENDEARMQEKDSQKVIKNSTRKMHTTKTIEKNLENLNTEKLECDHMADPLFHKMSQAFDEGGAKGMLMTNMVCIHLFFNFY
jgi:condensin complex subunit 2